MSIIVSERGSALHICPVSGKKNKENTAIIHGGKPLFSSLAGCNWNMACYMVLDIIASEILLERNITLDIHRIVLNGTPMPHYTLYDNPEDIRYFVSTDNSESHNDRISKLKRVYQREITIKKKNIKRWTYLSKTDNNRLDQIVQMIADFKFKSVYEFKGPSNKFCHVYDPFNQNPGSPLSLDGEYESYFDVEFIPATSRKHDALYKFKFKGIISALFLHNLLTGGVSYLGDYEDRLKKCTPASSMLYRKFLMPYNKFNRTLKFESVSYLLNWSNKDPWTMKKKFESIIFELEKHELIEIIRQPKWSETPFLFKVKKIDI